jgi:phage shock protein PspC (stress-responsive transcriptional regulator)
VIAVGVILVNFGLLYVVAYVIKGFMKPSDENKDKE